MINCDPDEVFFLCTVCVVVTAVICSTVGYALGRRRRM